MSGLATNYCPYCGREIPQFPTGTSKPGQYCYDNCPEGEGKRISLLSPPEGKRPYTPGESGLFKRRDGTEFNERKR